MGFIINFVVFSPLVSSNFGFDNLVISVPEVIVTVVSFITGSAVIAAEDVVGRPTTSFCAGVVVASDVV